MSAAEGRVLHGLIRDASGDIVVRLDEAGFILDASDNARELGLDLSGLLFNPHIGDIARAGHNHELIRYAEQVFAGESVAGWIEFPVEPRGAQEHGDQDGCESLQWYAFSLRLIDAEAGAGSGALGLLRSVAQKREWQNAISNSALTDPVTGLANRHALTARLQRVLDRRDKHVLSLFAVDRLRALFMQYGQRTADEIMWGFAKFLETMTVPGQELSQVDTERFGIVLQGMTLHEARLWADDVVQTFAELTTAASTRTPDLTASAGLACVDQSVDWTLRQAELGLVLARAGGGARVGISSQRVRPSGAKRLAR